jgi:hypothetical protein
VPKLGLYYSERVFVALEVYLSAVLLVLKNLVLLALTLATCAR